MWLVFVFLFALDGLDLDVAMYSVRVRADLMRGLDDLVKVGVADAAVGDGQLDRELEALGLLANVHAARDGSVR